MKQNRFFYIDFLRAVAIIGVIAIHTFSYNLYSSQNTFIWNYLHFVVVAFVFCSGYVLFHYKDQLVSLSATLPWYKKRFSRLLIPFYVYIIVHYALIFLFPSIFSGLDLKKTFNYFIASVTFYGGIGLNWLPLLFLQLTILVPFFFWAIKKKWPLWVYIFLGLGVTMLMTIFQFPYSSFKADMWIPWSLVLLLGFLFASQEGKNVLQKFSLFIAGISSIVHTILWMIWSILHRSHTLIDNKYPPNFFYLSYDIALSFFVLAISPITNKLSVGMKKKIEFVSQRSYGLFFIHYIVLDAVETVRKKVLFKNVFVELILVYAISFGMLYAWTLITASITHYRSAYTTVRSE